MSSFACPWEAGGRGQGCPDADSPSAPLRFPSGSSAAPSEPVQRSYSPPEAGGTVGCAELSGRRGLTISGVVAVFAGARASLEVPPRSQSHLGACVGCLVASDSLSGRGAGARVQWWLKLSGWLLSLLPCLASSSGLCTLLSGFCGPCSIAVFPRHRPQLLPRPAAFRKSRQDSASPVVQMLGPTAVSACALRDGTRTW